MYAFSLAANKISVSRVYVIYIFGSFDAPKRSLIRFCSLACDAAHEHNVAAVAAADNWQQQPKVR